MVKPYLWMLLGAACFSVMGALAKELGHACTWQVTAVVRAAVALVLAVLLALWTKSRLVFWRPRVLWMRSIAGSVSMVCAFYAIRELPLGDAYTISNMFPLWVAALAWPLLGRRPQWGELLAVAVGLAGAVCVLQPHFKERNFAVLVAVLGSMSTAVAMMGLHQIKGVNTRAIVAHFSGVAVCFCLAALVVFPHDGPALVTGSVAAGMLLAVGVAATAGQLCLTKAFSTGEPTRVSVVALSQVGFTFAYDILIGQRNVETITLVGLGLVLAPTIWLLSHRPPTPTEELPLGEE